MKKFYTFLIVSLLIVAGSIGIARAHETVNSGTATMFVHIDPTEPPVAGVPATVLLNLTNKEKGFSVEKCNCTLTIGQNEKPILTIPLVASSDPNTFGIVGVPVTFPTAGTYDITVDATPVTPGLFTKFETDFDTPVLAAGSTSTPASHAGHSASQHALHYILFGIAIVACLVVYIRERKEIKRLKREKKQNK